MFVFKNIIIDFMSVFALKNNESYVTYDPVMDTYLNTPSLTDLKIWDFHHDPKVLDPEIPEIKCVELSDVEVNQLKNLFGTII